MFLFSLLAPVGAAVFIVILLKKLIDHINLSKVLPPGPSGWPLLGMFPQVKPTEAHLVLSKWAQEYGPMYSFYNGKKLILVLSDLKTLKDALIKQGDIFAGRPRTPGGDRTHKNHGLLNSDGPLWKEQRRFALSTLRDFGFGKPILENKIREEIEFVVEEIHNLNEQPTDLQSLLNNCVSNVICSLVFGQRFDYSDASFQKLLDFFNFIATRNGQNIFSYANYFPFMRFLPRSILRMRKALGRLEEINQFCNEIIDGHKAVFAPKNEPEDYIHAFMAAEAKSAGLYFTDFQLLQSVLSLFIAGTETTSTTLRWAIMLLAQHLDVQNKVRSEISELVGAGNAPGMKHKSLLPYTEAVLNEVQRIANLVPLSLPHRTEMDTYLNGYFIPKNTTVVPLLWNVHRDPNVFPKPNEFNPDRFLVNGKISNSDTIAPFSIGKRACLGESLAKMELFLFFTALMQSFTFELPAGVTLSKDYDLARIVGVTSAPLNFEICAKHI